MKTWQTKPRLKRACQWHQGDEFPGVNKEVVNVSNGVVHYRYFVVTIHEQRVYLEDGDYVVQEPDGKHYYPCKPGIWEAGHELVGIASDNVESRSETPNVPGSV